MALNLTERRWPRRLLHVPSMTSLSRSKDGYYGTLCNPPFNALSYTWGRFALEKGLALDVSGISWQIPRIAPNHFTVTGFQNVLRKAAAPNGLVWVDIACIDQENLDVKMDEIGKQCDIFRLAGQVYIWLTSLESEFCRDSMVALEHFADHLERMELAENTSEYKAVDFLEQILGDTASVRCKLGSIFRDPWFSSLWTLQEACLCEHAILLTESGHTVPKPYRLAHRLKTPPLLEHLISDCQTIKTSLLPYAEYSEEIKDILLIVDRSGLSFINPGMNASAGSLLLYSAARYRTTTNPLDRIYGIMQAFEFSLGTSKEPGKQFTLPELEDQLGEALNSLSPMTAQMHVHTTPPVLGSAWRPSNSSWLPDVYYMAHSVRSMSTIARDVGKRPVYTGKICPLSKLHSFWNEATAYGEQLFATLGPKWQHYPVNIHLDATAQGPQEPPHNVRQVQSVRQPPSSCPCKSCTEPPRRQNDGLLRFLNAMPMPETEYEVLLLGLCTLTRWTRPTTEGFKGSSSYTVAARAGLLVVKEPSLGNTVWRRVGIASWEAGYGELKAVHEALWDPCQCYLS